MDSPNGLTVVVTQNAHAAHHPRHHYRLAAALAAAGHEVTMLARPGPQKGQLDAVPVEYLPARRSRLLRMLGAPLTVLRAARRRPDVVYVMTLELLPWAVLLAKLGRRRVAYDSAEEYQTYMLHKEWLPRRVRAAVGRIVGWLEPWLAAKLPAVTTALPSTYERFRAAGANVVLVRNFPPASLTSRVQRNGSFPYDILVGGSLWPEWVPMIADTARELGRMGFDDARWVVAGRNCPPDRQQLLQTALAERGVFDRFELQYDLPFREMPRLISSARVGLVYYTGDGVPQRIFEYMAAGLPFVAPNLPTTSQFVDGTAILATPDSPPALAEGLARLLRDRSLWEEISRRGPAYSRERYSWESEARKLTGVFARLGR
jgi:glycosyltransferase involved in cell wall biosynthesis